MYDLIRTIVHCFVHFSRYMYSHNTKTACSYAHSYAVIAHNPAIVCSYMGKHDFIHAIMLAYNI